MKEGLNVNLGDEVYYVNNGTRASHGDVQKVNRPKKGWNDDQIKLFFSENEKSDYKKKEKFLLENGWEKSWSEDNWVRSDAKNKEANTGISTDKAYRLASTNSVVKLNCYRIDPSQLENPNIQNIIYLENLTFNKRVEPLLLFKEEIRNSILVKNPEERPFFTKQQCELINGLPFKLYDQDDVDKDLLTMEKGEVGFGKMLV